MKIIDSKVFYLVSLLTLLVLTGSFADSGSGFEGKLNVNAAKAEELALLPGVGEHKALSIVELREKIGGFKYLDDLLKAKGMGKKLYGKILPYIKLDGESDLISVEDKTQ